MWQQFISLVAKSKITVENIEKLSSLVDVMKLLEEFKCAGNKRYLRRKIEEYESIKNASEQSDVLIYLDQLFDVLIPVLRSSVVDSKLEKQWSLILRELLIKVPYDGDQLEQANSIREDLDNKHDLGECTERTKALLLKHVNNAHENRLEVYSFLKNISSKLQGIYGEINTARESCENRKQSKLTVRDSLANGMKQIKNSINADEDIDILKKNLNRLVDALQHKVEEEYEQEENDTQILERTILGLSEKVKSLEDHAQDLEATLKQKHEEAITDPLTGLYNRAAYIQALERAWMIWQEKATPATLLVWDIDHFKRLNDRYGHAAGDKVLQSVARKLKTNVSDQDMVARFGGEEFVMLLHNRTIEDGEKIAERVRGVIASTEFTYKKQPLQVTISCGVATFSQNDTPTKLFERADKALYEAKHAGRNKVLAKVA